MSFSCIVGILICIYALHVEHSKESNKEYRALCDISEYMSCSNVLTSKYGRGLGLPINSYGNAIFTQRNPIYGLFYYTLMFLLSCLKSRIMMKLSILLSCISVLGSIYLCYILFFILRDICLVCLSIYAVNIIICYLSFKRYTNEHFIKKSL